ncbi:cellulose synthase/poly-beta-1,6-N-acetylglucosamine synthase-like glycosyltransferase [Kitasatospora sp. MAP12-15]|uniref:glycosyltransferase n=1 Tax=unclassified Kitasatospora TaxID=2633591 RepID=UPI002473E317|nr:glycosyltransferase family 2 protein [Kitasatospora sp. MAP12-44]MDH6108457.1 cellulose synthase/poly-beta-1,6-N-acetylglucosamine synthase-like glycosyltransferase [Kitasatospora sp. MAP12-44]
MYHPTTIALLAADVLLMLLIVRQPLSRTFDDSDRGSGQIVQLPPVRRPSLPRLVSFLVVGACVCTLIVALRHPQLDQAYSSLVADTLSATNGNSHLTMMYAHSLPPLLPAAVVGYLVTIAAVLPTTPGRRLMILAHAPLFVAFSVLTNCFTALIGAAAGLPLGPVPLLALVLQSTFGYFLIYRLTFTTYRLPRITQLPSLRRGDWRDNLVLLCCLLGSLSIVAALALALASQVGDHPIAMFLILASLRSGVTDLMFMLLALVRMAGARKPRLGTERPALNVIIPAYNEAAGIERLLASIDRAAAAYGGPVHAVLCDDGSTDDTRALAEAAIADYRYATGEVIQGPHAGKAKALNLALARCTADFVYRVDADCAVDPNAFAHSIPHFISDPRVGVVGALTLPKEPYDTWIDRMRAMEQLFTYGLCLATLTTVDAVPCVPGTFCAFRRQVALDFGGFVHGMFGEDAEFTCAFGRLGWRVVLDPHVISYEDVPVKVGQLRVQRFRWGLGGMMNFARYTPFGQGAPGPRFWFELPRSAGIRLVSPIHLFVMLLAVLYGVLQPQPQHNLARFAVIFVLVQIPALIPRLCVILYYRRAHLLAWIPLWLPFTFLKRFFQLESTLACGTRPVRLPLAVRTRLPALRSALRPRRTEDPAPGA